MSRERAAVRTILEANLGVTALLGSNPLRVHIGSPGQNVGYPYAILMRNGEVRGDPGYLVRAEMDCRIVAQGPGAGELVEDVGEAIREAIDQFIGPIDVVNYGTITFNGIMLSDVLDFYEPPVSGAQLGFFVLEQTYTLWYQQPRTFAIANLP